MTRAVPAARAEASPAGTATADVLFVGAGASTAYVLLGLLEALGNRSPGAPQRITVVERAADPFTGVPYGERAARTSLLITPLRDFLPDAERARFADWLRDRGEQAFAGYRTAAGPAARRWWARHRDQVERGELDDLYLPRHLFGEHLAGRTRAALAAAEQQGTARTDVVRDDVLAVEPAPEGYRVRCRGRTLHARRVVLATGSPPVLPRLPHRPGLSAVLVDDPFDDMAAALDLVRAALRRPPADRPAHVVLVGGNAGTMDVLYQIGDLDVPAARTAVVTVLTPRGELPDRVAEHPQQPPFAAEALLGLRAGSTAEAVHRAALADIARGRAAGLSVSDTLRPVSEALGAAVRQLDEEQALEFAGRWGAELGRSQRRAGWEYCEVSEQLSVAGRLRLVAGALLDVGSHADGTARVEYGASGEVRELAPADVVVNCAGPPRSLLDTAPPPLAQLLASGVCRTTPTGTGIAVDDTLSAAPDLFVMGPLLAGNVVRGAPVWHMEHCGRISSYGAALGADLARALAPTAV